MGYPSEGVGCNDAAGIEAAAGTARCRRLTGVSQSTMNTGSGGELEPSA